MALDLNATKEDTIPSLLRRRKSRALTRYGVWENLREGAQDAPEIVLPPFKTVIFCEPKTHERLTGHPTITKELTLLASLGISPCRLRIIFCFSISRKTS